MKQRLNNFLNYVFGNVGLKILMKGFAVRVTMFYPAAGEGFIEGSEVTLYENGLVHIKTENEETTTHINNCEIIWNFDEMSTVNALIPIKVARKLTVVPKGNPDPKNSA